jgi:hypothetical protein
MSASQPSIVEGQRPSALVYSPECPMSTLIIQITDWKVDFEASKLY